MNLESPYSGDAYIVDARGQLVKRIRLNEGSSQLQVNDMAPGVYRMVIQKSKEGKVITRNFVVVR
ncbi:hypothetical protein D3C79_1052040 [compost metagenome]